jgi:hypothetical protein
MAGDRTWDSVWRAAAETDRSGALALVAVAIALVVVLVAGAVWARLARARAQRPMRTSSEATVAEQLPPLPG